MTKIPKSAPALTDNPRSDYPLGGTKTGPAWRMAWTLLRKAYAKPDTYLSSGEVSERVHETYPEISPDTVKNLLLSAYRFGILVKTYELHNSRNQAHYRISDEWIAEQV